MEAKVKKIKITGKDEESVVFSQNIFISHLPFEGLKFSFEFEGGGVQELEMKDLIKKEDSKESKEEVDEADKGDKE